MDALAPRLRREARILVGYWLLPLLVALLPYRAGVALARRLAARLPLYDEITEAAWRQYATLAVANECAWKAEFRLTHLLDHAELFWSLTRSDAWIRARMAVPALGSLPRGALLVLGFHYGQGLWLLRWLRSSGRPTRLVALRFSRAEFESALHYAYARLRMRAVDAAAGAPTIYTGGSRPVIAQTLEQGGCVYGLVDVAVAKAAQMPANGRLFGHAVVFSDGLLDAVGAADPAVLVVSARRDAGALLRVDARVFASRRELTMAKLASELQQRLDAAPAAWHFWTLWPLFLAGP